MKKILFILLSLILFSACSNSETPVTKETVQQLNRIDFPEQLSENDVNYNLFKDYSNYLANDFTGSYTSVDDLQVFFDENYSEKKAKVVCHEHVVDYPDFHYVTVQSNGNYYLVFVNTEYDPPRTIVYPFGAHNPCGQVSAYLP